MRQKIFPDIFQISKYAILNTWKKLWAKKLSQVFFRFVSMIFKIFEKTILAKKVVLGIFGLVSMVF